MDTGFRSVIRSDGTMHFEHEIGNARFDLSDGSMTQVLGSIGLEQTVGNMRFNLGQGNFDQLL